MSPIPLIRVSTILPFVTFLSRVGSPVEKFLNQSKLSLFALDEPEKFLPRHQTLMFAKIAARREGIENLGLLVGQQTSVIRFGAFGRLMSQSLTLYEALSTLIHGSSIFNSGETYWFQENGEQVWFCQKYCNILGGDPKYAVHYSLMLIVNLIQMATGAQWKPREIYLQSAYGQGLTEIELFADTQIHLGQEFTAIAFPCSYLTLPLKLPLHLGDCCLKRDYELLESSAPLVDFPGSIRQVIQGLLGQGYPDIHLTAEIAMMSVRTFQRRLAANDITYSRLIEQARFHEAVRFLKEPELKIVHIASKLGYQDSAHFTRAFKRWTGISPREFRLSHYS